MFTAAAAGRAGYGTELDSIGVAGVTCCVSMKIFAFVFARGGAKWTGGLRGVCVL